MKKFLDFTAESIAALCLEGKEITRADELFQHQESIKKKLEKLSFGLTENKFPHIYFFDSEALVFSSLFMHLIVEEVPRSGKNQILFEATAQKEILKWAKIGKKFGALFQPVAITKDGEISKEHLEDVISPKTLFLTQRLVHPVLGTIQNFSATIFDLLKSHGIFYHVDVSEAFGVSLWDFSSFDADFVTINLSTISKDLGGIILLSKQKLGDLSYQKPALTLKFLNQVIECFENHSQNASMRMLKFITLKMQLAQKLKEAIPEIEFLVNAPSQAMNKLTITLPKVHSEALGYLLLSKKILVDLGGDKEQSLSSLLETTGFDANQAVCSISLTLDETYSDEILGELVKEIKDSYDILLKGAL